MAALGFAVWGLVAACGREPIGVGETGPIRFVHPLSWVAQFPPGYEEYRRQAQVAPGGAGDLVAFTKVRIRLNGADGSIALDTVVAFPPGSTELQLTFPVRLPVSAPASGVPLALNLRYVNAAGDTVFTGGPVTINAVPNIPGVESPAPVPVTVDLAYSGPGAASATQVRIAPRSLSVKTGEAFAFTAQALDASGNVVEGVPILWASGKAEIATVNAATGAGVAGAKRGEIEIQAQLLTGPADHVQLTVVSPPASIESVSGSGQTGPVGVALTQPVVVRVVAGDGGPAAGVAVSFVAGDGGSVGNASVVSGADGLASTTWTLGAAAGAQTLTASAAGLTGSPITFTATGRSVAPVRLAFTQQPPATATAGTALAPSIRVSALDAQGDVARTFDGAVTLALGEGSAAGGTLLGTATVNAVDGVATFGDLSLRVPGAYSLAAAAPSLTGAASSGFAVSPGPASRLVFQSYPVAGSAAGSQIDPITVAARDAFGNVATSFNGAVTLALATGAAVRADTSDSLAAATQPDASSLAAALVDPPVTISAVAGIATFPGVRLTRAAPSQFSATATGLTSATGPSFVVQPGPPSQLTLVSGGGQTAMGGSTLAAPIVVKVSDAFNNAVGGVAVTFAPAAGGGVAGTPTVTTSPAGLAQTSWTLGNAAGSVAMNVSAAGITGDPLVVSAVATKPPGPGPATQLAFTSQPTTSGAGVAMSSVIVVARDAAGALATGFNGVVSLAIGTNPSSATIATGAPTATAVAGVATFTGLSLTKVGTGYTFVAAVEGLTSATSSPFDVTPGVPASITADSGGGQTGTVGTSLANPFVARVLDQFGNPVPGATVSWSLPDGAGTLNSVTTTTDANGRVRATLTLGNSAGTVTTSVAATVGELAPAVFTATAIPGEAARLVFTTLPVESQAGVNFNPGVVVTATDASGNTVTSFTGNVTLALDAGGGAAVVTEGAPTLLGTTTVAAVAGVATFNAISMTKAAPGYAMVASSGALSAKSGKFRIKAGPARRLAADSGHGQSNTVGKKLGKKFVILATDEFGNAASGAAVTWTNVTGNGELEEQVLLTDSTGRASAGLKLGNGAGKHRVSVSVSGVTDPAIVFEANAVAGAAKRLRLTGGPVHGSKVKAGAHFPSLKVEALDSLGNVDSSYTGPVLLGLLNNPGADTAVAGNKSVNAVGGVATFSNANLRKIGIGYKLRVSGGDLESDSTGAFTIESGPAKKLFADDGHGQSSEVAKQLGKKFVIRAEDEFGNPAAGASVTWTNISGGGALEEQTVVTDSTGRASAGLKLGTGAGKHRVSAGVEGADDPAIVFEANAVAGQAKKLRLTGGPEHGAKIKAGAHFPALKAEAVDSFGNVDSTFAGLISLGLATNPGADTAVAGSKSANAAGGVATFSSANLRKIGKDYRLRASGGDLASDSTGLFTIESGPAKKVFADDGQGQASSVGKKLAKKFVIRAEDEFGNPASGASVTWTNISGGGALEEQTTVTDSTGRASTAFKLGNGAGKHRVSGGVAGADDPAIVFEATALAGAAKKLRVTGGPAHGSKIKAGAHFPGITVEAIDSLGNVDSTFTGLISLGLLNNPGADTAVAGNKSVNAVGGVATFSNANLRKIGKDYRLRVSGGDLETDSTGAFTIEAGPAKKVFADDGHGQSSEVAKKLGKKFVIRAEDEFGNPAAGASVTWTNISGGGALEEETTVTDSAGRASAGLRLGTGAGKHRVSGGVAGADDPAIVFEANAVAGKARKLRLTGGPAHGAKLKAGAHLPALKAEAVDSFGNVDSTFTGLISLGLATNPGADTAVAGNKSANASGGVATFSNANLRKIGKDYRLRVSGSDLQTDSTGLFTIESGPAKKVVADDGHGQSSEVAKKLGKKFVIRAEDEFGNPASGASVTWTNVSGGGTLEEQTAVTDSTGRASAALKLGTGAGKHRVSAGVDGADDPAIVFEANAVAGKARKLRLTGGPEHGAKIKAGAHFPALKAEAVDSFGNVDSTFTGLISLGLATNPGADTAVAGNKSATASGGVATFSNANLRKIGKDYRLRVSGGDLENDSTDVFTIESGPAKKVFADDGHGQSSTVGKKLAKKLVIRAEDEFGNPASGASVTWTNVSGGGTLEEQSTVTDSTGRASTALKLGNGAGKHRVSGGVDGADDPAIVFEATALAGAAKKLRVTGGPAHGSKIKAGAHFPSITVEAIDSLGNVDSTFTGLISLGLATNPGADTAVAGGKSVNASGGVATFSNANLRKIGKDYRLRVSGGDLESDSTGLFTIESGPAKKVFADDGHGQSSEVAKKLGKKFVIRAEDEFGNPASGASVTWTNISGGGALEEQTTVTDSTGRASTALKLGTGAGKHRVSGGVDGADDPAIVFEANAVAGQAKKLRLTGGPAHGSKVKAGAHFPPLKAEAVDSFGNVDSTFTGLITLGLAANPGADSAVAGTKSTNAAGGIATFSNANLRKIGKDYRLRVAGSDLQTDSTGLFTIESGPAKKVFADDGQGQSSEVAKKLGKKFVIRAEDEFGNPASGASVTWTNISGGGALEEQTATTDSTGRASTALKLGNGAGKHRVSGGVEGADDPAIVFEANAVAGPAKKLRLTGGPAHGSKVKAGAHFPQLKAEAVDSFGNVDSTFTGLISLGLATNPGADTAVAGGKSANASGGVATFSNANLRKIGKDYRLRVSGGDLQNDSTGLFTIESGPAKKVFADDGQGQSSEVAKKLGKKFVIRAEDEFGNPASGASVTWTNVSGGGTLEEESTVTDSTGRASTSLKLGTGAGKHRVSGGVDGADDPAIVFEANALAGAAKKLRLTGGPAHGSKVKAGAHFPALKAEAVDSFGNVDSTFTGVISLGLATNPGADTAVAGGKSANASGGVATFSNANLRKIGKDYRLRVSGSDLETDSTGLFTIESGPAKRVFADDGQGQSSEVGKKLAKKFVIRAEDEFGNPASGASVTWTNVSGGGALEDQTTVTDSTGRASTSLKLGNGAGRHRVSGGVVGADDPAIDFEANAVAGQAKKLRVVSGPASGSNKAAGTGITVRVEALDSLGNVDSTYSGPVSLGFAANPGADTAVAGDKVLSATKGIAEFTTPNIRKSGNGYRLRASSAALDSDSTESFNVIASVARKIVIDSGNGQKGSKGNALSKPFVVTVTDDFDNAVSGADVVWSVIDDVDDIVSQTTVTTDDSGKARVTLTLGQKSGKRKIRAAIKDTDTATEFEAEEESGPPPLS